MVFRFETDDFSNSYVAERLRWTKHSFVVCLLPMKFMVLMMAACFLNKTTHQYIYNRNQLLASRLFESSHAMNHKFLLSHVKFRVMRFFFWRQNNKPNQQKHIGFIFFGLNP